VPKIYVNSSDGYCYIENGPFDNDFALYRDATASAGRNYNSYIGDPIVARKYDPSQYTMQRVLMVFDTSGIVSMPSSVTLNLYGAPFETWPATAYYSKPVVIKSSGDIDLTPYNLTVDDYSAADGWISGSSWAGHVTDYSSVADAPASWVSSSYNTITLNAAARADMVSLDEFEIMLVNYDYDYLNVDPPSPGTWGYAKASSPFYLNEWGNSNGGDAVRAYLDYTPESRVYVGPAGKLIINSKLTII